MVGTTTLQGEVSIEANTNGIVFNSDRTGNGEEADAKLITVERGEETNATIEWDEDNDEFNINSVSGLHLQGKGGGNALTIGDTTSAGTTTAVITTAGAATVASLSVSDGNITNVGDISLDTISSDGSTVVVSMDDNVAGSFEVKEAGNSYIKVDTTNGSEKITLGDLYYDFKHPRCFNANNYGRDPQSQV